MDDRSRHPALRRILDLDGGDRAFEILGDELSGPDLTTVLLAVAARRVAALGPTDIMRRYREDRFVGASTIDAVALSRVQLLALETASPTYAPIALAPTAPLGSHFVMGGTPQNNVVSTVRTSEVAADPTNSLALEAAVRREQLLRADARSHQVVRLAAAQRVTRAQRFDGPRSFAHFALFGLVAAGRDRGNYDFELEHIAEQIDVLMRIVRGMSEAPIEIRLTPFNADLGRACERLCEASATADITWLLDREREHGRGYYRNICFKLHVVVDGDSWELGDGGDVPWTGRLLQNRKERIVISGLGLDRLAMLIAPSP